MDIGSLVNKVLGLAAPELAWWQMMTRALVVYAAVIVLARLGNQRFMAKGTAFDLVLAIILGSVASRAITGNAPFGGHSRRRWRWRDCIGCLPRWPFNLTA